MEEGQVTLIESMGDSVARYSSGVEGRSCRDSETNRLTGLVDRRSGNHVCEGTRAKRKVSERSRPLRREDEEDERGLMSEKSTKGRKRRDE